MSHFILFMFVRKSFIEKVSPENMVVDHTFMPHICVVPYKHLFVQCMWLLARLGNFSFLFKSQNLTVYIFQSLPHIFFYNAITFNIRTQLYILMPFWISTDTMMARLMQLQLISLFFSQLKSKIKPIVVKCISSKLMITRIFSLFKNLSASKDKMNNNSSGSQVERYFFLLDLKCYYYLRNSSWSLQEFCRLSNYLAWWNCVK